MLSLKIMAGILSLFLLGLLPSVMAAATCCYGQQHFNPGEVIRTFAMKCMQLYCDYTGIIDERYFDSYMDCECCEYNGRLYKDGDKISAVCTDMTCRKGEWVTEGCFDECCSKCNVKNDPHITTFDGYFYHYHGTCNYSISQDQFSFDAPFGIYSEFNHCFGLASCIGNTTFKDDENTAIDIVLDGTGNLFVFVNGNPIVYGPGVLLINNVFTWISDNCYMFLGSQGFLLKFCMNEMFVWAYPNLIDQVNGLCGHYNMYQPDDFTTRNGVVYELDRFPFRFPISWLTIPFVPCLPGQSNHTNVNHYDLCTLPHADRQRIELICTDLLKTVHWDGHQPSPFIFNVAVWSCEADLCYMEQNGEDQMVIEDWKMEMKMMLEMNIMCEAKTTHEAEMPCPPESESESESEHHVCSEHGGCKHPSHFKAEVSFEIEFGHAHGHGRRH